jgi:hypothetical protein
MKKAPVDWDYFHGATEQNLLKLFEYIIDNPALSSPVLPEAQPQGEQVIY